MPGEHLVEHAPQGILVGPVINHAVGARLLRAHVGRCPHGHAGPGRVLVTQDRQGARHPEIHHHRVPVLQQDVLRLDVPVYHAALVRVGQGVGHLPGDLHGLRHGELSLLIQAFPQRSAVHPRHDVVQVPIRVARIVKRKDVVMNKRGDDLDFAEEARRFN